MMDVNENSPTRNRKQKNKKYRQQQQQQQLKLSHRTTSSKSTWHRFMFKLFLLLICLCIISIYHYLLSQIIAKSKGKEFAHSIDYNSNTIHVAITSNDNPAVTKSKNYNHNKKDKAVMIIASVPFNEVRGVSLWSQLECYIDKVDKVIITAAEYSKDIMDQFIAEISQTIPNFRDGTTSLEVRYFVNDNYDNGLWCDALNDGAGTLNDKREKLLLSPLLQEYDQFILVNDSVMAIRKSTELLDVLRNKNLDMVSLTYSLLGGYWLESNYRGFSKEGIHKLMDHICVPNPCEVTKGHVGRYKERKRHRCMVDTFEIPTAGLFERTQVWGLYHGDAPIEYFNATAKTKVMQTSPMWHSNYPYWNEILREKQHFPAVKISSRWMDEWVKKRNKVDYDRCVSLLWASPKASKIVSEFEVLMDKADSVNQIEFKKYQR